jgi:hypothetical protein
VLVERRAPGMVQSGSGDGTEGVPSGPIEALSQDLGVRYWSLLDEESRPSETSRCRDFVFYKGVANMFSVL